MAIALSFPIGKAVARPQLVFTAIFKPAIVVLNGFSNKVLNVFGLEAKEEISGARTPAELASLVRRSAAMGTLDAGTANFIARTLKFSGRTAADVMTPRIRVETIDADQPVSDIVEAAKRTGYSRFPVIGESSDDIRGVVHIKKAIAVPAGPARQAAGRRHHDRRAPGSRNHPPGRPPGRTARGQPATGRRPGRIRRNRRHRHPGGPRGGNRRGSGR